MAAGLPDLLSQRPRPVPPYRLLMLLGASMLVSSLVGEPPSIKIALAGYTFWILGVAHLLLAGHGELVAPMAARVQDLLPRLPHPVEPYHVPMLLGASILVFSIVGQSPSINVALAGYTFWILGVARLLLGGQGAVAAPMAAVAHDLLPQLPRPVPPYHVLMLLGASMLVLSVVAESPPVHAALAAAGYLLWVLGVARLQLGDQGAAAVVERLKRFFYGRQNGPMPAP